MTQASSPYRRWLVEMDDCRTKIFLGAEGARESVHYHKDDDSTEWVTLVDSSLERD